MGIENTIVAQARDCRTREDLEALYAVWAETYDADLQTGGHNYVAPTLVADTVLGLGEHHKKGAVLDAGCGTGLVGTALAAAGVATTIDGLDLSHHMLRVAEKTGAYENVIQADLTKEIARPDESYELVTCAGTFTHGHVGPIPALREFVRVVKVDGHVVVTVLDELWSPGGFEAEVDRFVILQKRRKD